MGKAYITTGDCGEACITIGDCGEAKIEVKGYIIVITATGVKSYEDNLFASAIG